MEQFGADVYRKESKDEEGVFAVLEPDEGVRLSVHPISGENVGENDVRAYGRRAMFGRFTSDAEAMPVVRDLAEMCDVDVAEHQGAEIVVEVHDGVSRRVIEQQELWVPQSDSIFNRIETLRSTLVRQEFEEVF